jgi:hypothetical protein
MFVSFMRTEQLDCALQTEGMFRIAEETESGNT